VDDEDDDAGSEEGSGVHGAGAHFPAATTAKATAKANAEPKAEANAEANAEAKGPAAGMGEAVGAEAKEPEEVDDEDEETDAIEEEGDAANGADMDGFCEAVAAGAEAAAAKIPGFCGIEAKEPEEVDAEDEEKGGGDAVAVGVTNVKEEPAAAGAKEAEEFDQDDA